MSDNADAQKDFRPEIQGLRAIAVLAVLAFHLWPTWAPGGYVGVDVFFVISGYLITGLLLREYERTGRISVTHFYARRIKRLLPAATIVLIAVAICLPVLPVVRWLDTANDIAASALYFQNWSLAARAVDYLASENAPSVLQHFWSLSVEEQYYIVWPLLVLAATHMTPWASRHPRKAFSVFVLVIGFGALGYSIYITPRDPGLAYFATTTRAWELALGGALAIFPQWEALPGKLRLFCGHTGIAMIVATVCLFSTSTPFPGYAALLPTVGAAMVIVAGRSRWWASSYGLLSLRPMQYIGDLSYSLYLWHWPLIVYYGLLSGRKIGLLDGVIIAVLACALAHQTKDIVEDYFRGSDFGKRKKWQPFLLGAACITASLVASGYVRHRISGSTSAAVVDIHALTPSLEDARQDLPIVYKNGCHVSGTVTQAKGCTWGSANAKFKVVLAGDSHAAQWLPALRAIANQRHWQITSFTKSACALVDTELSIGKPRRPYDACRTWGRNVTRKIIEMRPDIVITTQSIGQYAYGHKKRSDSNDALVQGLLRTWATLESAGIQVVALRDTPHMRIDVPDCLAAPHGSTKACSRPRAKTLSVLDTVVVAARKDAKVDLIDMTDQICGPKTCPAVSGHILVWRDAHHLTATFVRHLAPKLASALDKTGVAGRDRRH